MSYTPEEFMTECQQLGMEVGPIGIDQGLMLNAVVRVVQTQVRGVGRSGAVQDEVAGVYDLMADLIKEVPWKVGPQELQRTGTDTRRGSGVLERVNVVGLVNGVEAHFLEAVGRLSRAKQSNDLDRNRLLDGFKRKVEEEVEQDEKVVAARARVAEGEAEVRRRKGDLLAIQEELRGEKADRLEPYLYVAEGRGL